MNNNNPIDRRNFVESYLSPLLAQIDGNINEAKIAIEGELEVVYVIYGTLPIYRVRRFIVNDKALATIATEIINEINMRKENKYDTRPEHSEHDRP